ncbi:MAG: SAF domain-containing protein, partial [Thermodesulfobacteriota bacterium]
DSGFSLTPKEFAAMVAAVREAEQAVGRVSYEPTEKERESRTFRRSLFVVQEIAAGSRFTPENIRSIRPGHGLAPKHLEKILGRRATRDIPRGTPLCWDLVG